MRCVPQNILAMSAANIDIEAANDRGEIPLNIHSGHRNAVRELGIGEKPYSIIVDLECITIYI